MPGSEYEWFSLGMSQCSRCGKATAARNFEHDRNCLINIRGSYADLASFWYLGFNGAEPPRTLTCTQARTFLMGRKIKEKEEGQKNPDPPRALRAEVLALYEGV